MWHTISFLLINHETKLPHLTSAMNSQKMKIFFFFVFFFEEKHLKKTRSVKWISEWLRCSLREGSHWDKCYQINEGDDEAGRRRTDMIFLNCNHCCCQQSWHSSGWKILQSEGKRFRHERNTWRELSVSILRRSISNYCRSYKTQSFNQQWNCCCSILVLTQLMWPCRTGFLVRCLQHCDFVEQFGNTRGIYFIIIFSLVKGLEKIKIKLDSVIFRSVFTGV